MAFLSFLTTCLIAFCSDLTCSLVKGSFGVCFGVEELESLLDCCIGLSLGLGSDKSLSFSLSELDGRLVFCSDSNSRL